MLGTAFPAGRLLLVEQPFPWGKDGLRTSRFDPATALAVQTRAAAEGIRVQAIRRPGRAPDLAHRRWMLVDTRDATRSVRCGEFAEDAELLELPLDGSSGGTRLRAAVPRLHARPPRPLLRCAWPSADRSPR